MSDTIKDFSYLPNIDQEEMKKIFAIEKWEKLNSIIDCCNYERMGLDRFFIIEADLKKRYGDSILTVLDVGCNNGLISQAMANVGHVVTGVDNGIIDTQSRYDDLTFLDSRSNNKIKMVDSDVEEYLCNTRERWDCILLLSVLHQFENGYAFDEKSAYDADHVRKIVNLIFNRANKILYYECPYDEDGFEFQYGLKFLERYLDNISEYKVEEVAKTIGPNGVVRQLFAIIKRLGE